MAVTKSLQATTLNIEVENGVDNSGATKYKKKNFSGIKAGATPDALVNVAEAIKLVLAKEARQTFVSEISVLEPNA